MPKSLLDYYQENLEYMRDLGSDFTKEFPKIASRLELSENECGDPFVERLLEGAAFLAARVERKLDRSVPYMLESVLNGVLPYALEPIPAFAIAELRDWDRSNVPAVQVLQAHTLYEAVPEGCRTPCTFSTMIPVTLFPVELTEARYLTLDLQKYELNAEAGLYLKFRKNAPFSIDPKADELLFYLDMTGAMASALQQHLQTECTGVTVISNGQREAAEEIHFSIPMLDEKNACDQNNNPVTGRELFHQFAVFQPLFRFLRIHGLAARLNRINDGDTVELVITFRRRRMEFFQRIDNRILRMNCVPLCNLFRKKSDRIPMTIRDQHHLVPDRTNPLSYEVARVLSVSLFDNGNRKILDLHRIYDTDYMEEEDSFNFYSVRRLPRQRGDTERERSSYVGQEVYLSFSGETFQQLQSNVVQFSADILCTNRDLPLLLHSGSVLKAREPAIFQTAVLLTAPTAPDLPLISGSGADYAEKAACLMVNFSDFLWSDGVIPRELLRKMIHARIPDSRENLAGLERSILSLKNIRETFRYVRQGQVFFESGWRIEVELDEPSCAGIGSYIFGCLLREFLKSYKPINTPGKIVLTTKQQGRICEWMI